MRVKAVNGPELPPYVGTEARPLGKEQSRFSSLIGHPKAKRAYAWSYRDVKTR
jgi:hypothetical protein